MKIKYQRTTTLVHPIHQIKKGDWVDLALAEDAKLGRQTFKVVSLGIRMKLPKGFEAYVVPRSSTGKRYKILQYNSFGVIDNSYCGPDDIWKMAIYAPVGCDIMQNTDICQFRIAPKMNAGIWVKLKWLFTKKVRFVEVEHFEGENRGGFGSTH